MRNPLAGAVVVLLVGSAAPSALADDAQSPKRVLPDYDGRPRDDSDGAGVWLARVLLSPLYLTSEYVLRRPIGAAMVAAEHVELPRKAYDFFAFGFDHKLGFVPVALVEFGFNPSVGIYGFWNDALAPRNDLRLHYEGWPTDWLSGSITDRYRIDDRRALRLRVAGLERPDNVFYGVGPRSLESSQSRFTETSLDANATFEVRPWRSSDLETTLGFRKVDLFHGHYGDDPSVEQSVARGTFASPFGFGRGYTEPYERARVALDTRKSTEHGSGVRFESETELGGDVAHAGGGGWIRYGAAASAMIDLGDHGRVLTLSAAAMFADPLGSAAIPFTELVTLGGDKGMHGYFPGRLVDRSGAVAAVHYTWPIGVWLNGTMQASVGNVFGAHLGDFRPSLLRMSAAFGLASKSDPPLELTIGFGSETFEHGGQVDSVRVALGVPRSF
ncbi:MAG TPA: hypothetical protein VGH28_01425 [Polyangiaceae bacterium]